VTFIAHRSGRRYGSPQAMLDDIDAYDYEIWLLEGQVRAWRTAAAFLAIVAVLLSANAVLSTWRWAQAQRAQQESAR